MFNKNEKEYMMHALGIETWNLHRKRIIPYRNYYGVGGTHSATWEIWESLYCRGYATKSSPTMFHVSIKGLSELNLYIVSCIVGVIAICERTLLV